MSVKIHYFIGFGRPISRKKKVEQCSLNLKRVILREKICPFLYNLFGISN